MAADDLSVLAAEAEAAMKAELVVTESGTSVHPLESNDTRRGTHVEARETKETDQSIVEEKMKRASKPLDVSMETLGMPPASMMPAPRPHAQGVRPHDQGGHPTQGVSQASDGHVLGQTGQLQGHGRVHIPGQSQQQRPISQPHLQRPSHHAPLQFQPHAGHGNGVGASAAGQKGVVSRPGGSVNAAGRPIGHTATPAGRPVPVPPTAAGRPGPLRGPQFSQPQTPNEAGLPIAHPVQQRIVQGTQSIEGLGNPVVMPGDKGKPPVKASAPSDGNVHKAPVKSDGVVKSPVVPGLPMMTTATLPTLAELKIPQKMDVEFLMLVAEIFRRPAKDLSWLNLITKVLEIRESILPGDVLREYIRPTLSECRAEAAKDPQSPQGASAAFLQYLYEKLVHIAFTPNSVLMKFNSTGELKIPALQQWVLNSKNKRFPYDVCPDNKLEHAKMDAQTFLIPKEIELVAGKTGLPKLNSERGKVQRKGPGPLTPSLKFKAFLDQEYSEVQKAFGTKHAVLQTNVDGKPLIQKADANVSVYVPRRSLLWISVECMNIEFQRISIPDIGIPSMEQPPSNMHGDPNARAASDQKSTDPKPTDGKKSLDARNHRVKNGRTRRSSGSKSGSPSASRSSSPTDARRSRKTNGHGRAQKEKEKPKDKGILAQLFGTRA